MVCYGQDEKGLPPTPDTLHLGCSYHMHSSHHFLSTLGLIMLEKSLACPPLDMLRILFYMFNDTINGKLCLCENSPRFHQISSNTRSKIKISWGSMPLDPPSLTHALHMDTCLPLIYTISLCPPPPPPPPPLGKKLKETLIVVVVVIVVVRGGFVGAC